MASATSRSKLRAIFASDRAVAMATIFDPISSRIAEDVGFEAGLMGGSLVSHVVLGAPDIILLTLTELAEQVHRAARVSAVPIVVDCDHGYGNALSVMRTVHELDRAGAGAITIEDTLLPRAYGPSDAQTLLPHDESIGKIKAAVAARGDSDLIVLGRTSASQITGVADAIARFKAYESLGVDGLMIPGVKSREDLDAISAATTLPLVVGGIPESMCDASYLASRRARLWSGGHQTFSVAVKALHDAMQAVHEGTLAPRLAGIADKALMDRVTGAADYKGWTKDFLGGK